MCYKEALDASRSVAGNNHHFTLKYINNLASVLKAQGDKYNTNMILILLLLLLLLFPIRLQE